MGDDAPAPADALPPAIRALYPFQSRLITHPDGVRQHVIDEGPRDDAHAVVIVHGNPTWSFAFREFIGALRDHTRVIAVDHIGMGLSDKPGTYHYTLAQHIDNLGAVIEAAGVREVSLIVHDWGGAIGCGWAVANADRVRRLVVMNTAAFPSRRIPLRIAVCRWPLIGPIGVRGLNGFARAALTQATTRGLKRDVARGYIWPYGSWANRIAIHRFVQDIPLAASHPSHARLLEIEAGLSRLRDKPMLLAWGMRDWCFTAKHFLTEWEHRFPDAQVRRYDEAGHYVFEDAASDLLPRVLAFITAGHLQQLYDIARIDNNTKLPFR